MLPLLRSTLPSFRRSVQQCSAPTLVRPAQHLWFATVSVVAGNPAEKDIAKRLAAAFPGSRHIEVEDVSGGCGAMYRIEVESSDFKGKPIVKQHQAVADVLREDIAQWHGMRLTTRAVEPKNQ